MNSATLPKLSVERAAHMLTVDILAGRFPAGCSCGTSFRCGYCSNYQRTYVKVRKLLNRMEARES